MSKTFRQAFLEALEREGVTAQKVAKATGVSIHQLKKLKEGKSRSTNVDDAVKVARFFGMSLDRFLDDHSFREDVEIIEILMQLKPLERQFLLNAAKAQIAARDQAHHQSDEEQKQPPQAS